MLSDAEAQALILATMHGQGGRATKEELQKVIDWAEDIVIRRTLLQAVLDGSVVVNAKEEEIRFALTSRGIDEAEALLNPME